MLVSEAKSKLAEIASNGQFAHIKRRMGEYVNGFPLLMGKSIFIIAEDDDFLIDGYSAFKYSDVKSIRSNEHDRHMERMYESEGLMNQVITPKIEEFNTWRDLFNDKYFKSNNIIIECEDYEDFYIGKILKTNKSSVFLKYFDPFGNWEEEPYEVLYRDITKVSFQTRYITVYSKYIK